MARVTQNIVKMFWARGAWISAKQLFVDRN
jgi:hypothetical protein